MAKKIMTEENLGIPEDLFDSILEYLVERHLTNVNYNLEDGKKYITMYY